MPTVPAAAPICRRASRPRTCSGRRRSARGAYAVRRLPRGARLRVTNLDGDACAGFVVYNADQPSERLNVGRHREGAVERVPRRGQPAALRHGPLADGACSRTRCGPPRRVLRHSTRRERAPLRLGGVHGRIRRPRSLLLGSRSSGSAPRPAGEPQPLQRRARRSGRQARAGAARSRCRASTCCCAPTSTCWWRS